MAVKRPFSRSRGRRIFALLLLGQTTSSLGQSLEACTRFYHISPDVHKPAAFAVHKKYPLLRHKKGAQAFPGRPLIQVVETHHVRIHCAIYHMTQTNIVICVWQNTGTDILTRPTLKLLKYVNTCARNSGNWVRRMILKIPAPK